MDIKKKTSIDMGKKGVIRISSRNNTSITCYSLYDINDNERKCSFNKWVFIEYLKGVQIPKKYIKQVENM